MKRHLSVLAAVTFVLAGVAGVRAIAQTPAPPQEQPKLPTLDQVIDKWIAGTGGRAAIEKHTSRVSKGTIESPDAPLRGTVEVSEKAPDKALTVIDMQGIGLVREGTDGTAAWQEDPGTGLQDKTGSELAETRRGATFNAELKIKDMYKTLVVTGRENVGGKPAYTVVATPAEGQGNEAIYYFDTDTGLLVRQRSRRDTAQGPIDVDTFLEDYRDVDGTKMPFTIRQVTPIFTMVIRLSEVKHNVALDDAIFKKPGLR